MLRFSFRDEALNEPEIIACNNFSLQPEHTVSLLGVNIDARLDWRCHVEGVAKSLARCCYSVRVITDSVSQQAALMMYYAHGFSRMRYGVVFWGSSTDAARIFVLQRKCLRNIFCLDRMESCRPIFVKYGILTLPSIYIYEAVSFVLGNQSLFREYIRDHEYKTRKKNDLKPPRLKFSYIQKNAEYQVISIYNKIPGESRLLYNAKKLKNKLKTFLINKAYYSVSEYLNDDIKID